MRPVHRSARRSNLKQHPKRRVGQAAGPASCAFSGLGRGRRGGRGWRVLQPPLGPGHPARGGRAGVCGTGWGGVPCGSLAGRLVSGRIGEPYLTGLALLAGRINGYDRGGSWGVLGGRCRSPVVGPTRIGPADKPGGRPYA